MIQCALDYKQTYLITSFDLVFKNETDYAKLLEWKVVRAKASSMVPLAYIPVMATIFNVSQSTLAVVIHRVILTYFASQPRN